MRYLPLDTAERAAMLARIGVPDIEALFADIPADKRIEGLVDLPLAKSEMAVERIMAAMAARSLAAGSAPFFLGAGIEAIGDLGNRVLAQAPRPLRWRRWELGEDQATELVFRDDFVTPRFEGREHPEIEGSRIRKCFRRPRPQCGRTDGCCRS